MKVLITGATGFVGSHVADKFMSERHDVFYISRPTSNLRWLENTSATRVDGALHDLESLQVAVKGMDIIVHVAGAIAGRNEDEFRRHNVTATQNLLDAVRAYNPSLKRFLHVSSGAVVGPSKSPTQPVNEDTACRPLTAYGRTKLEAERIVNVAGSEFPITIVRPPAVLGPRDSAILTVFQTVQKGLSPLIGFNEKLVSLIYVTDLAEGIYLAAMAPNAVGQTYFITSDRPNTWPEITTLIAAALGKRRVITIRIPHTLVKGIAGVVGFFGNMSSKPPVLNYEKGLDITQSYWTSSGEKARRELGFKPKVTLANAIVETVRWYKANKWL